MLLISGQWNINLGGRKKMNRAFWSCDLVSCEDPAADQNSFFPNGKLAWSLHSARPWLQLPFLATHCHHQPVSSHHQAAAVASSHGTAHLTPTRHPPQAKAASSFFSTPPTRGSPMAGGRPLELSPADAGSPGANPQASGRRQRRRSVSEFYAELAALLPGIPSRASQVEIVDAAAAHVKTLENTAAVLEAYRAVQRAVPGRGVEVSSREAVCFAARLPPAAAARPGALARVLEAFHRRGVEILAATMTRGIGSDREAAQVTVTAAAAAPEVMESIKADIAGIE